MTIPFGRRRLIVSLVDASPRRKLFGYSMAINASDAELARLNQFNAAASDRLRWESTAALYGGPRPR
jgi:hypothetical protein